MKVNAITLDDRYPLHIMTYILDNRRRCRIFKTQVFKQEMAPEYIPKRAFNVENVHYEFLEMPFARKTILLTYLAYFQVTSLP